MSIKRLELAVNADVDAAQRFLASMGFLGLLPVRNEDDFVSFKYASSNRQILDANFGQAIKTGTQLIWSWDGVGKIVVRPSSRLVGLKNKPSKVKVAVDPTPLKPVSPDNVKTTHIDLSMEDKFKGAQASRMFKTFLREAWHHYNKKYFDGKMELPNFKIDHHMDVATGTRGHWSPYKRQLMLAERVLLAPFPVFNEIFLHEMCHQAVTDVDKSRDLENGGHGPLWTKWMRHVGLEPTRYDDKDTIVYMRSEEQDAELRARDLVKNRPQDQLLQLAPGPYYNKWCTLVHNARYYYAAVLFKYVDDRVILQLDPDIDDKGTPRVVPMSQVYKFVGTVEHQRTMIKHGIEDRARKAREKYDLK